MYKEIENYLERILSGGSIEELEKLIYILPELYNIGLIDRGSYIVWNKRCKERLFTLSNGFEMLKIGNRAKNALTSAGILTVNELRNVLVQEVQGKNFLQIRNLGERTAVEIVEASIKCGIIQLEEIGEGYVKPSEIRQWKSIKESIMSHAGDLY